MTLPLNGVDVLSPQSTVIDVITFPVVGVATIVNVAELPTVGAVSGGVTATATRAASDGDRR